MIFWSRVGWFANDFHKWRSDKWKSFPTRSYLVYSTGKWWKLPLTYPLCAMGLSIAVLWHHMSMDCDVIWPNFPLNISKGVWAFSHRRQVDYYSLIIHQSYHGLTCKKSLHHSWHGITSTTFSISVPFDWHLKSPVTQLSVQQLVWITKKNISEFWIIVRRAGLLWSQQDFEWRWSVPLFKCLTVLEFSFILFDLCLLITFFNFIMNYVPIITFWIFTYHKIWILSVMFCFIWSYWIIYFLACL